MMIILRIFALIILLAIGNALRAQQDPQLAQYMFNKAVINPAAAGSDGGNATLLYRTQWVNQPGAPKTIGLVADMPIPKTKAGVGLNVFNTTQGPLSFSKAIGNYSYKIEMKEDISYINLGLQAGFVQYNINQRDLRLHDDISKDQTFNSASLNKIIPDFGFGIMFRYKEFYAGATVPHLLQSKVKFISETNNESGTLGIRTRFARIFRHYYFTSGGQVMLKYNLLLFPSVLVKYVTDAPVSVDFNANFLYDNNFWGGLGYRTGFGGAYVVMAGVQYKKLKIGYAFELTRGPLAAYTGTTHELMLNYHFNMGALEKSNKKPYFLK